MQKSAYSVAVVGATGLVGQELVATLEQRLFPLCELRLYGSLRSAGDEMRCGALTALVAPLDDRARFESTDIVFLAAGEQVSAEWLARCTAAGAVVIDTSQLFAGDPDVPVVVPEVNAADIATYVTRNMIVSPDVPAIALAVALKPLREAARVLRVVATTFEPVSGLGRPGIDELQQQTIELMAGRSVEPAVFPHRIAFNVVPQAGETLAGGTLAGRTLAGGISSYEQQTVGSLRRLLDAPDLPVSVTRVRVPLFFGSGLTANVETESRLTAAQAREVLRASPGVLLQDDAGGGDYPTPADVVGQDATFVGRIREDETMNVLDLWLTIDNLRKGSAVNAVQIAELLIRDYL
jgi:aspartate-semialdehyde dehydrogenase